MHETPHLKRYRNELSAVWVLDGVDHMGRYVGPNDKFDQAYDCVTVYW